MLAILLIKNYLKNKNKNVQLVLTNNKKNNTFHTHIVISVKKNKKSFLDTLVKKWLEGW